MIQYTDSENQWMVYAVNSTIDTKYMVTLINNPLPTWYQEVQLQS